VRGAVAGDAVAIAGDVVIEGDMAGDAVAIGGGIRIGPAANFAGDAVPIGGPVQKDPAAHVAGDQVPLPWFAFPGQRHLYLRGVAWAAFAAAPRRPKSRGESEPARPSRSSKFRLQYIRKTLSAV
jgi:hypothetical protein